MARVEGEILIARPVKEVFDLVADERNEPRYNPRMLRAEKLTPGPVGAGTRFRAKMALPGRGTTEMTVELTACERPAQLASRTQLTSMDIAGTLTFAAVPGGTRMAWRWDLRPHGALRLLGPLIGLIGARQERAIWTSLKRLMETEASSGSAAPSG